MRERLVRLIRHPRGAVTLPQLLGGAKGADQAQLALAAIRRGLVPFRHRRVGEVRSFAETCCLLGRVDVLRAVVEIGIPEWEFKGRDHTRRDWLQSLCEYVMSESRGTTARRSLYRAATEPIGAHTRDALVLALEYLPDHPDVDFIRDDSAECAALLTEAEMHLRLRQVASATGASACASTAPARRVKAL